MSVIGGVVAWDVSVMRGVVPVMNGYLPVQTRHCAGPVMAEVRLRARVHQPHLPPSLLPVQCQTAQPRNWQPPRTTPTLVAGIHWHALLAEQSRHAWKRLALGNLRTRCFPVQHPARSSLVVGWRRQEKTASAYVPGLGELQGDSKVLSEGP